MYIEVHMKSDHTLPGSNNNVVRTPQLYESMVVFFSVLQTEKLRRREVQELAQICTNKGNNLYINKDGLTPELMLLTSLW